MLLEVENLKITRIDGASLVKGISFSIEEGE